MSNSTYLQKYKMILTTKAPVFIGSGNELIKKEYYYNRKKNTVDIYDMIKLFEIIAQKGLVDSYERFMFYDKHDDIGQWLRKQKNLKEDEINQCIKYTLEITDSKMDLNSRKNNKGGKHEISLFVKDSYGMPYVPGSSLKGALRTIIMAERIRNNSSLYERSKKKLKTHLNGFEKNRLYNLKEDNKKIEEITYYHNRFDDDRKKSNAVNDELRGLLISDSKPLKVEDLILCQRADYKTDGDSTAMPMIYECIKPNTKIEFDVTIDTKDCFVSKEKIEQAIEYYTAMYNEKFVSKFAKATRDIDIINGKFLYLGGNVGFANKAVIYSLFGAKDAAEISQSIFTMLEQKRRDKKHHEHDLEKYGVSPRVLKCARYRGKNYQFGHCKVEIIKY